MRDVYLWTGYGLGGFVAGRLIVALVRRWLDWQDRRTATAPPVLYTEVWLAPPAEIEQDRHEDGPVKAGPQVRHHDEATAWTLTALADARKAATDTYATLGEFARRVPTGHAWIGMEVEASTELRRLAVAA